MKIRFVDARPHHAALLARSMRQRDVEEIRTGWCMEPELAMREALSESYYAQVAVLGLEPLCAFGLAPLTVMGGSSRLWIFATQAIDRHPIAFARASKRWLPELFARCNLATNLIACDDAPALKWLEWLGGTCVLPAKSRGGRLFAQFILADSRTQERTCRQG